MSEPLPRAAADGRGAPVTVVRACLRAGTGGSPTAVLDDGGLTDAERREIPAALGTSHAAFVSVGDETSSGPVVGLRFFTSAGELPACGHGTLAALAFLAARAGQDEYRATLRSPAGVFTGRAVRTDSGFEASFDCGPIAVREPAPQEHRPVLAALGVTDVPVPGVRVAELGRPRLLVPVPSRDALHTLAPDFTRLREACDALGLLGCYVYTVPTAEGRVAARMFAPSIDVPEDIANANSTACLAAFLAGEGVGAITVDMGDAVGVPATLTAATRPGANGRIAAVGGTATIDRVLHLLPSPADKG
jgi:PhzF family phenazine biosynthesis protein